jgi:dihydrofolate reductase
VIVKGYIITFFINLGLIDVYRLAVHPTVLGTGKPLFENIDRVDLKLAGTKQYKSGVVQLVYEPRRMY